MSATTIHQRRGQNALRPVSQLPPELLEAIFAEVTCKHQSAHGNTLIVCMDCQRPFDDSPYRDDRLSASQVCHHWRQVALDSPRLWTSITTAMGNIFMEQQIIRASTLPLTIHIYLSEFVQADEIAMAMRCLCREIHRIKEFRIDRWSALSASPMKEWYEAAEDAPNAVSLETVVVAAAYLSMPDAPAFLCHPCPSLRVLRLEDTQITQISPNMFPSLQSLTLRMGARPAAPERLERILALLGGLPFLTTLSLSQGPFLTAEQPPTVPVQLPRLRSIALRNSCILLLRHLILPKSVNVSLSCHPGLRIPPPEQPFAEVGAILASHFARTDHQIPAADDVSPISLWIKHSPSNGTSVKSYGVLLPSTTMVYPFAEPRCSVVVRNHELDGTQIGSVILQQCKAIPIQSVRQLCFFDEKSSVSSGQWVELLGLVPLVEELRFEARPSSLSSMLMSLGPLLHASRLLVLPSLRTFALRCLANLPHATTTADMKAFMSTLNVVLSWRKRCGQTLEGLTIDLSTSACLLLDRADEALYALATRVEVLEARPMS